MKKKRKIIKNNKKTITIKIRQHQKSSKQVRNDKFIQSTNLFKFDVNDENDDTAGNNDDQL